MENESSKQFPPVYLVNPAAEPNRFCSNAINAARGKGVRMQDFNNTYYKDGDASSGGGGSQVETGSTARPFVTVGNTINAEDGEDVEMGKVGNKYLNYNRGEEGGGMKAAEPRNSGSKKKGGGCGCFGM